MFKLTTISIVLFITTIINFLTFYASWQKRNSKGGDYFSFGMLAATFWVLVSALDYAAVPISTKIFFAKLETIFYNTALILFFAFFMTYAGYDHWLQKKWVRALLWLMPSINIFLPLTNEFHGLFWSGFSLSPVGDNVLIFHHGPGFRWVAISGYIVILIMIVGLVKFAIRAPKNTRQQALILLFALLSPTLSNILYHFQFTGLEGIDWTSVFFSFSGLLILLALFGARFLDIVPVARRLIVERMMDPIIVLDSNQHIIDINPAACKIFGVKPSILGNKVTDIFAGQPTLLNMFLSEDTLTKTLEFQGQRFFDPDIASLSDYRERVFARLFVFRNVTERHRATLEQKQRLEEIQALNESLKLTQNIVIEQARTLAKVEERERLGRDLHDSVNQSIHSVILSAETLQALLSKDKVQEAAHVAGRIQASGLQALKEIRLLLYEIASPLTNEEANFIELMEERLQMVERRIGIHAEVQVVNHETLHCSRSRIENLYWLAIEALNNALKHAHASKILIILNCAEEDLIVEIKDNGVGFDMNKINRGGFGMRSMQERAALLGGEVTFLSALNQGTSVRFCTKIVE